MPKLINKVGNVYGRITVISFHGYKNKRAYWNCECSCGNLLPIRGDSLHKNKSCGCAPRPFKHLETGTKEYKAWDAMKYRCLNPKCKHFNRYGGRGISISDRWIKSYNDFISDVGRAPSKQHSLERRDNNGNYNAENCYWATKKQQSNNRHVTKKVTFRGETKTLVDWCDQLGINYFRTSERLKHGWTIEDAMTLPYSSGNNQYMTNRSNPNI